MKKLLIEIIKGKSLGRTLVNLCLLNISLNGEGLDIGNKKGDASYYRFLSLEKAQIQALDLIPQAEDVQQVDLEQGLPFPDSSKDFILAFNLFEHIFEYKRCIDECCRVLKAKGKLIGCVPFLYPIHLDPSDHFRYTKMSLEKIFCKGGFRNILVEPLGFGPISAATEQYVYLLKSKILKFILILFSLLSDKILNKLFRGHPRVSNQNFPLQYFFIVEK